MTRYVLDSYAILAYYWDEDGAGRVEEILTGKGHTRWMSVINLGEVYYKAARRVDIASSDDVADDVLRRMLRLPVEFVDATAELTLDAARIKAKYRVAYADSFAAALAKNLNARVVTGDEEFGQLERDGIVPIEWLPPKPKRTRR
jgi:predicted nucleic acid-binding protein